MSRLAQPFSGRVEILSTSFQPSCRALRPSITKPSPLLISATYQPSWPSN